jgi:hypothetical protein
MPAEAGIQSVGGNKNFNDLDSGFRRNDPFSPLKTQSLEGKGGGDSSYFLKKLNFALGYF